MTNDNGGNDFPPGRIFDLKADLIDIHINQGDPVYGILVTFTAPGGDLDQGRGLIQN